MRRAIRSRAGLASAFALALVVALLVPTAAFATQVFVTTTVDRVDGNTSSLTALNISKGPDAAVSLREAVLALRGETLPAQIVLAGGTYTLESYATTVSVGLFPEVVGGSLDVTSSVHIVGAGSTIARRTPSTISDRIFDIDRGLFGGVSFVLEDATLSSGRAEGVVGGGAIRAGGAAAHDSVTLNRCTLANNSAIPGAASTSSGGALNIGDNVDLALSQCSFTGNSASGVGGAIFVADTGSGTLSIGGSTFTSNVSNGGAVSAGQGGAIYARVGGASTIATSTFTGNVATSDGLAGPDRGGALFVGGTTQIRDNRIALNTADEAPGAYGFLGTPDAKYNWWGYNSSPTTGSPVQVAGGIDADQWMRLTVTPTPASVLRASSSALAARVGLAGHIPPSDGLPVAFSAASLGTVAPASSALSAGVANSTFTAGMIGGPAAITATFDNAVATTTVGVLHEPGITASGDVTFTVGATTTVGVSASGYPIPTLSLLGSLPSGLAFAFTGSTGTTTSAGTISGNPAAGTGGRYSVSVVATNGIAPDASAPVTVTVVERPHFTSASETTVTIGVPTTFTITTTGYPAADITALGLPAGLALTDNGDGTAIISGTPTGTGGIYDPTLDADNHETEHTEQGIIINVQYPATNLFLGDPTFSVGIYTQNAFDAEGLPVPDISVEGALPDGLTWWPVGMVTDTLGSSAIGGTPAAGTGGLYPLIVRASNGIGAETTSAATLTVLEVPGIGAAAETTLVAGQSASIEVTTSGYPMPTLSVEGELPGGLAFTDNGDGTGVFSGTLGRHAEGEYTATIHADNWYGGDRTRTITLHVVRAPAVWESGTFTWDTQADFEHNASTVGVTTTVGGLANTTRVPGSVALPHITAIAAGDTHSVGLKSDGTVVAIGNDGNGQCNVSGWSGVDAIATGHEYTVGLKSDGTVMATGNNGSGQCNVSGWTGVTAVAAGGAHTVGLKSDGTMVAVGSNGSGQCNISGWTGMTAIAAGAVHTVGVKSDASVVATGNDANGQCNVSGWTGVTAVTAGEIHTVGLRSDGTVVAIGNNGFGQCNVSGWTGITAVAAGGLHTVGLKSDGTVVATGNNNNGQCNVSSWTGITAIAAGDEFTVGLKSDGTVVATGRNNFGQCNVFGFRPVGTMGGADAAVGLRSGADPAFSAWSTLVASTAPMPQGGAVKFGVRLSGDGMSWTPVLGRNGNPIDWTTGSGNYFGAVSGQASRTDLSTLPKSRYIDVVVRMEAGSGELELDGVTVTYDRDDTVAPIVADDAPGAWQTADTTVTVTATDTLSGVDALTCVPTPDAPVTQLDTGTVTIAISAEGTTSIDYSATDDAGNRCATQTATVRIDRSAPDLAISASLAAVSLDASDSVSGLAGVWYSVDGGPTQLYVGGSFSPGASGTHVITAWATDVAGHMTAKSAVVAVDTQAPTASDDAPAAWQSADTTVTLAARDAEGAVSGIDWVLGGASVPGAGSSAGGSAGVRITAEGTTTIEYSATDVAGNRCATQTATVRIDKTSPISVAAYGTGWQHGPVTVMLSAGDALSGATSTWYRTNPAAAWTLYTGPFQVAEEGASSVQYRAYDLAGNAEDPQTAPVQIDNTPPVCADDAPAGWINHPWQLQWSSTDALSGVAAMDADYTGAYVWPNLHVTWSSASNFIDQEGTTTLVFASTDAVGNTSAPHTATLRIDRTAPSTTASHTSGWSSAPVAVTLDAADAVSGVAATYYRLGSSATTMTYSDPFTLGASGSTTVTYWSVDLAGNAEAEQSTVVRIDDDAPSVSDDAPSGWRTSDTAFTVTAADAGSGVAAIDYARTNPDASTDADTESGASVPFTITAEGTTTVAYSASDAAGNRSVTQTATVRVDKTAPVTTASHASGWSGAPVTIALDATDTVSGVAGTWYRVGSSGRMLYDGPFEVGASGETTVTFWSVDVAGNAEDAQTTVVGVDQAAPAVSDDAPTSWQRTATDVHLSATDAVSGVAAIDYTLTAPDGVTTTATVGGTAATIPVSAEGTTALAYSAIDSAGNRCATQTVTVRIDTGLPTIALANVSTASYLAKMHLSATDTLTAVTLCWRIGEEPTQTLSAAETTVTYPVSGVHTITAWALDEAGNSSALATHEFVVVGPAQIVMRTGSAVLPKYRAAFTLAGDLVSAGQPVPGVRVVAQSSADGVSFRDCSLPVATSPTGAFSLRVIPSVKTVYRVRSYAATALAGVVGPAVWAQPRALLSNPVTRSKMKLGRGYWVSGTLGPRHAPGPKSVRVYLWRWEKGRWKSYGYKYATLSGTTGTYSRYRIAVWLPKRGSWRIRSYHADAGHAPSWSAKYAYTKVR